MATLSYDDPIRAGGHVFTRALVSQRGQFRDAVGWRHFVDGFPVRVSAWERMLAEARSADAARGEVELAT